MTSEKRPERTIGGLAGNAVGKAKEALGHAADRDEREPEGEVPAAPDQLADRVAAEQRDASDPGGPTER